MGKLFAFMRGAILGAGCMYILDPNLGKSRRALLRDKAVKAVNDAEKFVDKATVDLGNRASGIVAEARGLVKNSQTQMRQPLPPGPRLVACLVGSAIGFKGLRQGGIRGLTMLLGGCALAAQATTNGTLNRITSAATDSQPMEDQKTVETPSTRAA